MGQSQINKPDGNEMVVILMKSTSQGTFKWEWNASNILIIRPNTCKYSHIPDIWAVSRPWLYQEFQQIVDLRRLKYC